MAARVTDKKLWSFSTENTLTSGPTDLGSNPRHIEKLSNKKVCLTSSYKWIGGKSCHIIEAVQVKEFQSTVYEKHAMKNVQD